MLNELRRGDSIIKKVRNQIIKMKKFELMPTEENLIESLRKDFLKRNKDLVRFYELLEAQEEACSIAIDGRGGRGKTLGVRTLSWT